MMCDTKRPMCRELYKKTHIYSLHETHEYHLSHTAGQQMIVEIPNVILLCKINATKKGTKNSILHTIIYHHMTSYGYISMLIADSCITWFHLDCIMQ